MKKGKTAKLKLFNDAKCYYGTVDYKNLKTIYIVLQSWVEPIKDFDDWNRANGNLKREIKHILLECVDYDIFEKHNIVDLDLRSSGIQRGKRSFLNLEITLYVKSHVDFKSNNLKNSVKTIIESVYKDAIKGMKYFKVHKDKLTKELV